MIKQMNWCSLSFIHVGLLGAAQVMEEGKTKKDSFSYEVCLWSKNEPKFLSTLQPKVKENLNYMEFWFYVASVRKIPSEILESQTISS
jgi:hypothetical protein